MYTQDPDGGGLIEILYLAIMFSLPLWLITEKTYYVAYDNIRQTTLDKFLYYACYVLIRVNITGLIINGVICGIACIAVSYKLFFVTIILGSVIVILSVIHFIFNKKLFKRSKKFYEL